MEFGVTSRIVLPIVVSIVLLCFILVILLWFIITRYKFKLFAMEIKNLDTQIQTDLEKKKEIIQNLIEEDLPIEVGQTIKEYVQANEQFNQLYLECEEKKEQESTEVLEQLLSIENHLALSIQNYNQAVATFNAKSLEFPHSLVVGTNYDKLEYFDNSKVEELKN